MLSFTYSPPFLMFQFFVVWCLFPRWELLLPRLQGDVWNRGCVALQQHGALPRQPADLLWVQEGRCHPRQVLSPSSPGSQLPPFSRRFVRLEQSPDVQEELGLGAVHTLSQAPGLQQLLHVLPTDLSSQEFKLNFPFSPLRAQRAAACILSLLRTRNGFGSWHYSLTSRALFFLLF